MVFYSKIIFIIINFLSVDKSIPFCGLIPHCPALAQERGQITGHFKPTGAKRAC